MDFTVEEACEILKPEVTPRQLRNVIRAVGMRPVGIRRDGHIRPGRPRADWYTYEWAQITELHKVLQPFLQGAAVQPENSRVR